MIIFLHFLAEYKILNLDTVDILKFFCRAKAKYGQQEARLLQPQQHFTQTIAFQLQQPIMISIFGTGANQNHLRTPRPVTPKRRYIFLNNFKDLVIILLYLQVRYVAFDKLGHKLITGIANTPHNRWMRPHVPAPDRSSSPYRRRITPRLVGNFVGNYSSVSLQVIVHCVTTFCQNCSNIPSFCLVCFNHYQFFKYSYIW